MTTINTPETKTAAAPATSIPPPVGHNGGTALEAATARTFTLARPIIDGDQTITTLTIEPPELRHLMSSERGSGGAVEQTVELVAALAGIKAAAVRGMALRDLRAIERAIRDMRSMPGATMTPSPIGAVFALAQPLKLDNGPSIANLAVREPDVEASIAVEAIMRTGRRNGETVVVNAHEQTAAMIASLTGLTIPVVSRLRLNDLAAIEAWLAPFVLDTASTEADGATSP